MEAINTVMVSETSRIVVTQDEDSGNDCPLSWTGAGYVSIRSPRLGSPFTNDPAGTAEDVRLIVATMSWHARHGDTEGAIETAIVKHYARQGYVARRVDLRGGSQSDWHDGFLYVPASDAEWIESVESTLRAWYEGSVYVLTHERLETWTNADGDTRDTWEHVDSLGGVYVDAYDDVAVGVEAASYFDLAALNA